MRIASVVALCLLVGCASLRADRRAGRIGIEWVPIPDGVLVMGDVFEESNTDALPLHRVVIDPFEILRYEVTFHQYDAFARATDRRVPKSPADSLRGDRAVEGVDWDEALAFCEWIGGRLPSEQEWEWAASGGAERQMWAGTSDTTRVDEFVRHIGNSLSHPGMVGRKLPNRFGLFDMSGNVAEWIGAYYQYYPEDGEEPSRYDLETFGIRIVRGGSYSMAPEIARTDWRAATLRDVRSPAIGFRCAR